MSDSKESINDYIDLGDNSSVKKLQNEKPNVFNTTVGSNQQVNNQYNKIIYQSFTVGKQGRGKDDYTKSNQQICDILDDYRWTLDTFNKSMTSNIKGNNVNNLSNAYTANIPHCYLVEYQQKMSSNITNFINTLVSAINAVNDQSTRKGVEQLGTGLDDLKNALWEAVTGDNDAPAKTGQGENKDKDQSVKKGVNAIYTGLRGGINWLAQKTLSNSVEKIQNGISSSKYLAPYKLLYDLTATNQRYVFPMVSQPPSNKVSNTYGEKQDNDSILSSNNVLSFFDKLSSGVVSFTRDLKDLGALWGHDSSGIGYQLSYVEKAKFFNYPTETEQYTITFPLLNTVKANKGQTPDWKKNYKFIMLFTLRNMVFRRDNASFFPPLFYDLVIPGVIRQPFCYVKDVSVKPLGMTRMLGMDNLFSFLDNGSISVAVPEAWIVTIKMKSLLATSANMVLSGLTDLSIKVK